MQILSHRGHWLHPDEKNSRAAFERAFKGGFGVETDLRDCGAKIVISHDPPTGAEMTFDGFLELYTSLGTPGALALNVKSDGLGPLIRKSLDRYEIKRYFLFDMSVPDMVHSLRSELRCFSRESEHERPPLSLYGRAEGVWMDCFEEDWISDKDIFRHLEAGKTVCLVSPELHRRPHRSVWESYKKVAAEAGDRLALCTDFPLEAKEYFHE